MFGFGAHHSVQRRQLADGIGRHQHGATPHSSVTVGSISGIKLVRAAYPLDRLVSHDGVTKPKYIVTRDAETLRDAFLGKPFDNVIADCDRGVHARLPFDLMRDDSSRYDSCVRPGQPGKLSMPSTAMQSEPGSTFPELSPYPSYARQTPPATIHSGERRFLDDPVGASVRHTTVDQTDA